MYNTFYQNKFPRPDVNRTTRANLIGGVVNKRKEYARSLKWLNFKSIS